MTAVLAAIPYTTFPTIELGPLELRTFGFVVAVGVLLGAWFAARHGEGYGVPRDSTYNLAMRMVLAGVVGARLTWVLSHLEDIDGPIDVIAVWEGGLQFSGGFIAAILVGFPVFRRWNRLTRWHSLDGYAYGLAIGLAIGRVACYSVGEHFGRQTSFFLGVRYEGGSVREATLGDVPLRDGMVFHQTALYELLYLVVLFAVLTWLLYLRRERPPAGVAIGVFCAWYGVCRFLSDSLRVNDERVLMMTGAQYFALALIPAALWIFLRVRRQLDADVAAGLRPGLEPAAVGAGDADPSTGGSPDAAEADGGGADGGPGPSA